MYTTIHHVFEHIPNVMLKIFSELYVWIYGIKITGEDDVTDRVVFLNWEGWKKKSVEGWRFIGVKENGDLDNTS
jgi:hypothetical protein